MMIQLDEAAHQTMGLLDAHGKDHTHPLCVCAGGRAVAALQAGDSEPERGLHVEPALLLLQHW
jgi:hypothetical protein